MGQSDLLVRRSGGRGAGVLPPLPLPPAPLIPSATLSLRAEGVGGPFFGLGAKRSRRHCIYSPYKYGGSFADIGAPSVLCESNLIGTGSRADLYQQNRNGSGRTKRVSGEVTEEKPDESMAGLHRLLEGKAPRGRSGGAGEQEGTSTQEMVPPRPRSTLPCLFHQTSRFSANFAFCSINSRRGSTRSPMSRLNIRSHSMASSSVTRRIMRFSGSMVVSRS